MAFYTTDDFLREAQRQLGGYQEQLNKFDALVRDTEAKRQDLLARLTNAYADLGAALLPELNAPAFDALANRLGVPELRTVFTNGAARQGQIDVRLDQIEKSDLYTQRENRVYDLEKQLSEVEPVYTHARDDWERLNAFPRIHELMTRQYGTLQYPHRGLLRFFNGEYLMDWRQADDIVAKLGLSSFPEVAARFWERKEQVEVLGRSVGEIKAGLRQVQNLVQERDNLLQERENLPRRVQELVGRRLAPFLQTADMPSLPNPDALKSRVIAIDGMEHQVEYLEGLKAKITEDRSGLAERTGRLQQEEQRYATDRYRYRNKRFSQDQFNKRFDRSRIDRYEVLNRRYSRAGETIYVFNDYNRVSPLEEFLWWDIMTDGRIDGNFIPEVYEYRQMNPAYAYERPDYYNAGGDSGGYDSSNAAYGDAS